MKLNVREAAAFVDKPDPKVACILLHGADAMRVALKRERLVDAIVGPKASEEMRLTRLVGAEVRRDPPALLDAVKAVGFFPGPRVVLIDEAGDGLTKTFLAALEDWRDGDACIVATAGRLGPRGALRKAIEGSRNAAAIAIYSDPPSRADIARDLKRAGLEEPDAAVAADLEALASALDPGDFAQFLGKLALYKHGDSAPLSPEDIAACAPAAAEADHDLVIAMAADGSVADLTREIRRVPRAAATTLAIASARHFRALHAAASSRDGPEAALSRARPPVFGPRKTRMAAQARALGADRLERALSWILDADLELRSGGAAPPMAVIERVLVRIAMLKRR